MLMKIVVVLAALACKVHGQDYKIHFVDDTLYQGHACTNKEGTPGICINIYLCDEPEHVVIKRKICGYEKETAVVCCTNARKFELPKSNDSFADRIGLDEAQPRPTRTNEESAQIINKSCDFHTSPPLNTGEIDTVSPSLATLGWQGVFNYVDWNCTGSLIENFYVLTAAHCVSNSEYPPIIARVGDFNVHYNQNATKPVYFNITRTHIHPEFDPITLRNNIAILKLNPYTKISEPIQPICMWTNNEMPDSNLLSYGYEETEKEYSKYEPIHSLVNAIGRQECLNQANAPQGLADDNVCVMGSSNCRVVNGDELQTQDSNGVRRKRYLTGISSHGQPCNGAPKIYTKVASHLKWISDIVWP